MEGKIKWILSKYNGMERSRLMRHRMRMTNALKLGTEAMVSIEYRNFSE